MDIINQIFTTIKYLFDFTNTINFFIILLLFIIFYNLLIWFFRDLRYIKAFKQFNDPDNISIKDLNDLPLFNIIVPAWKEGKEFEDCLSSISNLSYPKIRAIVNAGGTEECINIANSFKNRENFKIIYQKEGKSRASLGKIKAVNECLPYINEGLIYIIDADCTVDDEIVLRLIHGIVNLGEEIVCGAGTRPLKSLEHIALVQYLLFSRFAITSVKVEKYDNITVGGATTCITFHALKKVGKFNENKIIAEDRSRAQDLLSKGFKIYTLKDYRSRIYTDFPKNFRELLEQRKRYFHNTLIDATQTGKVTTFLKFIILSLVSIYFIISPLLIFINFGLFMISFFIILFIYIRKIRKYLAFKLSVDKQYYNKFRKSLIFKMFYYIYIELIINIITLFSLMTLKNRIKTEITPQNI